MIRIFSKKKCCGCSACASICPKSCIVMKRDEEGFCYPSVDETACVDCHQCEKVCPFLNPTVQTYTGSKIYAAVNTDSEVRLASSSGGVFTEIATHVIKQGGCVFGAAFQDDWNVKHCMVENIESLSKLRKSKYVQSNIGNTYKLAKAQLLQGRLVLFSGTSCQIAGLKHFLHKEYDNLITVEILCHGVPSPKVWQLYLAEFLKGKGYGIGDLCNLSFRDKVKGITEYKLSFEMNDKNSLSHFFYEDSYMDGFLSNLILRPSCYSCMAKGGRSGSDIVLGDLWNKYAKKPFDDSNGTNVVLVNTDRGFGILEKCNLLKADISDMGIDYYKNSGFQKRQFVNPYRKKFFSELKNGNVMQLLNKYSEIPVYWRMIRRIKRILKI